jgi:rhodanese-related sulfurtransferase
MAEDRGEEELAESIDAEEARTLIAAGSVKVFDVRSAEDFADERINGSTHCDPDGIAERLGEDHRDKVLVVCADGEHSAEVAGSLRDDGIDAASLEGGFGAWTGEHLPTAPNPDEEYEGPPVKIPGAVDSSGDEEDEEEGEDDEGEEAPAA